jgi:hypothetical protein
MRRVWLASVVAAALLVAIPANAAASTYTNPNPVAIPEGPEFADPPEVGRASPYPSTIPVTDLPGAVTRVRATLVNLSHSFPFDLDVALVAPNGSYTVLMDDVCDAPFGDPNSDDIVNLTFTFDDAAATTLPLEGPCVSGTYDPFANPQSGFTVMPPPAPQGELSVAAMSALNGSPGSGSWNLFLFDQLGPDDPPPANILAGGWTLDLLTDATCSGRQATLTGTADDDELVGTPEDDVILGFGGKDTIRGLGGKDRICGGPRKDTLRGGSGKDRLLGQGGKDKLSGGGGKDVCKGGKKDDTAKKCEVERSI